MAMTLNNLAVFYKSQKRFAESAVLYRRALAIFEQTLDPSHPKFVTCRENYDRLLREMDRHRSRAEMFSSVRNALKSLRPWMQISTAVRLAKRAYPSIGLKSHYDESGVNPAFARVLVEASELV